jgi:hypothetical protein
MFDSLRELRAAAAERSLPRLQRALPQCARALPGGGKKLAAVRAGVRLLLLLQREQQLRQQMGRASQAKDLVLLGASLREAKALGPPFAESRVVQVAAEGIFHYWNIPSPTYP